MNYINILRWVKVGNSVFIIAEISANHGNDINIVKETMLKAKEVGANAVKIQTYKPDTITLDVDNEHFTINDPDSIWKGRKLYDLYQEGSLPWEWHVELYEFAKEKDIVLFSTPFDFSAVNLLEKCDNPIYKIASFEINDIPLIKYAASKMKPMIMSTGIAAFEEINEAVEACRSVGNDDITLLKCTSEYPAKIEDANLVMIQDLKERFKTKVGLSDHTLGSLAPVVAVAVGAEVIEKHFILDQEIGGTDASFSMNPDEFKEMVEQVRITENSLGIVDYETVLNKASRDFRRSLFISKDVKEGDVVTEENIQSIRPGFGLAPKYYNDVIGKMFEADYKKGTPLSLEMFSFSSFS